MKLQKINPLKLLSPVIIPAKLIPQDAKSFGHGWTWLGTGGQQGIDRIDGVDVNPSIPSRSIGNFPFDINSFTTASDGMDR